MLSLEAKREPTQLLSLETKAPQPSCYDLHAQQYGCHAVMSFKDTILKAL